jgi:HSP20 family protein
MTTLAKNQNRNVRRMSPSWLSPFNRFLGNDFTDLWESENPVTVPSINIKEEKDKYEIEMAAPGLNKEDFNIDVDGNLLTISCEKETESEDNKTNGYARKEYNYSRFTRSFTLPDYADADKINAKYQNGILDLTIPKKPEAQKTSTQKIKVH